MATREGLTAREGFVVVVGWVISVLLVMTGTRFYARDFREGILFLASAAAVAFVFFRKRKIALTVISLSWVLVNAGLTAPLHPSVLGYTMTIGSAAGLYFIARWSYNRYPYLSYKQMHTVFEGEAAMDAENARIEAEARELVKKRPYGPWLLR
jgi:hypothetical protein